MAPLDRLRAFVSPPPAAPAPTKALGRSGTLNFHGFISEEEFNAALRFPQSLRTYDQMRRSDPTVRWMLALVKTPIRGAEWSVEPASASPQNREIAAFCEHCLFDELSGGFDDFLRRALTMFDFGHSVAEILADVRQVEFGYEDELGNEASVSREAIVISQLAERLQRTIQKWVRDENDTSKLDHVEQWLGDAEATNFIPIPADRLIVFTNEQEGDDWRGVSLLRTAYRSWQYKQKLENIEAIAQERATGLPVVYPPENATEEQLDGLEDALRNLRQGESVYMIMPGPKAGTVTEEGGTWFFDAVSVASDANHPANDAIQRHELALAKNVLAEFMMLGHQQVGARATADVQQDPYRQAVEAYVGYLEEVITEQVLGRLVRWNYGDAPVPKLKASKLVGTNLYVLGNVLAALVSAQGLTVDLETENSFRDLLSLPRRKLPSAEGPDSGGAGTPPAEDVQPLPDQQRPPGSGPTNKPGDLQVNARRFAEFIPPRPLTAAEQSVNFAEIQGKLDSAQESFPAVVENAARPAIQAAMLQAQAAVDADSPEDVSRVDVDGMGLMKAVDNQLQALYAEGQSQVSAEIARQKEGKAFDTLPAPQPGGPGQARIFLAQAATAAASMAQAATRAIRAWALRQIETGGQEPSGPGFEPFMALRAEAKGVALGLTSTAFNAGREAEIKARADEITTSVYSSMLDTNTCAACESADGEESLPGEESTPCPNPDCEGGGACRCIHVPVVTEVPATP